MCDIYGGSAAVWCEVERRARKQHFCCECGEAIPKGHRYLQINTVFDGSAGTYRRHLACELLWEVIAAEVCGHPHYSLLRGLDEEISEADEAMAAVLPRDFVRECNDTDVRLPNPFREAFELVKATYRALEAQGDPLAVVR